MYVHIRGVCSIGLPAERRALGVISWWYLECIGLIYRRLISVGLRLADPSYHVVTAIFSNDYHQLFPCLTGLPGGTDLAATKSRHQGWHLNLNVQYPRIEA
jgi:hypothetical protein